MVELEKGKDHCQKMPYGLMKNVGVLEFEPYDQVWVVFGNQIMMALGWGTEVAQGK